MLSCNQKRTNFHFASEPIHMHFTSHHSQHAIFTTCTRPVHLQPSRDMILKKEINPKTTIGKWAILR